jgi:hypothetical protein
MCFRERQFQQGYGAIGRFDFQDGTRFVRRIEKPDRFHLVDPMSEMIRWLCPKADPYRIRISGRVYRDSAKDPILSFHLIADALSQDFQNRMRAAVLPGEVIQKLLPFILFNVHSRPWCGRILVAHATVWCISDSIAQLNALRRRGLCTIAEWIRGG